MASVALVVACAQDGRGEPTDGAAGEAPDLADTAVANTIDPASVVPEPATTSRSAGVGADGQPPAYRPPDGWALVGDRDIDQLLVAVDDRSLEVQANGAVPIAPGDVCARRYEVWAVESETAVDLTLVELGPAALGSTTDDRGADNGGSSVGDEVCAQMATTWRLTVELAAPLGERALIDGTTGEVVPAVTRLADALAPAVVPAGWEPIPPAVFRRRLTFGYVDPATSHRWLSITSEPVDDADANLDALRTAGGSEVDEITIRATDGLQTTSVDDGAITIAWVEDGRLYQVYSNPDPDVDVLRAVADGLTYPS